MLSTSNLTIFGKGGLPSPVHRMSISISLEIIDLVTSQENIASECPQQTCWAGCPTGAVQLTPLAPQQAWDRMFTDVEKADVLNQAAKQWFLDKQPYPTAVLWP